MKNIFKTIAVLFLSILIFSCNSENNQLPDLQNNEEQALIEFEQQISQIKATLNNDQLSSKSKSNVATTFDIRMKDGNYIIENIEYLDEFEYGFIQGFTSDSKLNNLSSRVSGGGIKVSCDETGGITECPELSGIGAGMRQAKCVGNAVKACLDGGGCAEVCSMKGTIEK